MSKQTIVIIGAGPAGLTAAYTLLKNTQNYQVIILEQEETVGGISKTINFNGYHADTGIHRFFSKNKEIEKMWREILPIQAKPAYDEIQLHKNKEYPKNGSNPETDEKSLLIKDRMTRIYYGRKFYDYPVAFNKTTIQNIGFLTLVKAGWSYLKVCIKKMPETTLENFFINRFGKVLYTMFFESYTEKVWGKHPREISADWGVQRVKGISIKEVIKDISRKAVHIKNTENTETSLIEQFVYPKLGAGQMWEEMAKEIEKLGGKMILQSQVNQIQIKNKKITEIQYNGLHNIQVDTVISSMPLKDLFEAIHEVEVPKKIYDIATNLPYREFMSVCMVVDKINLKNTTKVKTFRDMLADSWIYIQEPDVKMGRMQIFNNWSPYLFKNKEDIKEKVLIGLEYFCSENDELWNMPDKEFIKFAEQEAIKIGILDQNCIQEAIRIKIPKAYPAYFGTYEQIDEVIQYIEQFDNLYCIGRNGQHRYNNMDHSMLTGIEAVNHILNKTHEKKDIWKVNTEKEYHEIKKEKR